MRLIPPPPPACIWSIAALSVAASALALAAVPGAASAQQVQATASGTEVRLDPNNTSPVIATLDAGAVLEFIGESGPYYAVSIPGPPGQDNLVGYVLASQVEVVGAPAPTTPAGTVPPPPGTPPGAAAGIPALQAQYDREEARRNSGQKRAIQGAAMMAGVQASFSVAISYEKEEHQYPTAEQFQAAQERRSSAESIKDVALMAGGAIVAYGVAQYVIGWQNMKNLELELPRGADPTLQEQYNAANADRLSGRKKVIAGAALAVASFATLEYVPHLGVPDPEDYETSAEYLNAVDRRNTVETAGNWFTAAGLVLGAWGATEWVLASRKMAEIEGSARTTAAPSPLSPKLFVGRTAGRTEFGLNWAW